MMTCMASGITDDSRRGHLRNCDFTPRERSILCLIAAGLTTAEAARRLHVSRHTAAQHINDMLRRAGASNRGELIARAYAAGALAAGTWPPQICEAPPVAAQPQDRHGGLRAVNENGDRTTSLVRPNARAAASPGALAAQISAAGSH